MVIGRGLPPKKNFSEWYHALVRRVLIDQRYPLKGFLVYKPLGYKLFENCLNILERLLTETGHEKCYFPLLIPECLLKKEETHIAGFRDEVFWVTYGGRTRLGEKSALRPTSETAMYEMLRLWISSWRDLPIKLHQSCSVFRYETEHTRPLIRDREILWNEAHTSHATLEEAAAQVEVGVQIYRKLFEELAIPTIFINAVTGIFAGAEMAIEPYTIFPDGRALEMGSVNNLGQKFSRAFGIKFKTKEGREDYVYQTCYGVSERLIAAIVAVHGDDKGLILPPKVAPTQVIIIPIYTKKNEKEIKKRCQDIKEKLLSAEIKADVDFSEHTPGYKFNEWELRGVPVRIEIGEKELKKKSVTVVRRDTGEKKLIVEKDVIQKVNRLFREIHQNLFERARKYHSEKIKNARNIKEIKIAIAEKSVTRVLWCGDLNCASKIEKAVNAPFIGTEHGRTAKGKCINCGKNAKFHGIVGKMY